MTAVSGPRSGVTVYYACSKSTPGPHEHYVARMAPYNVISIGYMGCLLCEVVLMSNLVPLSLSKL
jgi:hypothetical protein